MSVEIYFYRIGKKTSVYREGLVEDNGVRLRTTSQLDSEISRRFTRHLCSEGLLPPDFSIAQVNKYLFYNEWFNIIELLDSAGGLIGYYCDICTPLQRDGTHYAVTDIFLDLWILPDGHLVELDWDEFEQAVAAGLVPADLERAARSAMSRLIEIVQRGELPQYLL